jgi:hypothetical protein
MVAIPSDKDIGYPVRVHWAADQGPARNLKDINWFVVHDTEGTMASDEPELTRDDAKVASCHALIAPDGLLVFMVPLSITAWTPGNDYVAERSINVEMSGFQSKGYTEAQYKSMAAFFRWCLAQGCNIPAEYAARTGRIGIIGHQDVPNPNQPGKFGGVSGHTDPGPLFDWNKFIRYIKEGTGVFDPIADYVAANGGEAVFGKRTSPGQYGTNGSIEADYEFAHMYLDKATGKVVAEMKDRVNPLGKDVGPGVYSTLQAEGMTALTNEDYYVPEGNKPGLTKRSFTYADKSGVTYRVEAIQDQDAQGKALPTWTRQIWQFIKEVK